MSKKGFFEKKSNKRAMVISLMVALILLLIEAIRWGIELAVDVSLKTIGYSSETYGYGIGLVAAVIILFLVFNKFSDVLDE